MNPELISNYDLSIQQKRVWKYRTQHELPELQVFSIHITGQPDAEQLRLAIARTIAGQELFRQRYQQNADFHHPVTQIGQAEEDFFFSQDRYSPEERQEQALQTYKDGIPFSVFFIEQQEGQYLLELHLPALSMDTTAYRIFFDTLCRQYLNKGFNAVTDEEAPVQFLDFSEWQNDIVTQEAIQGSEYWRRFTNAEWPRHLPYARADKEEGSRYETLEIKVQPGILQALQAFATRHGLLLENVLLSAYSFLLQKLCATDHLLIGLKVNGRVAEEVAQLYGYLDQYIPLDSADMNGKNILQWVQSITEGVAQTHKWQLFFSPEIFSRQQQLAPHYLPFVFDFEDLQEIYADAQVTFSQEIHLPSCLQYDLSLHAVHTREGALKLYLRFNTNKYEAAYMELFRAQYESLLQRMFTEPVKQVAAVSPLSEAEHRLIFKTFNQPLKEFKEDSKLLHQLFEDQARKTPDHIAIDSQGITITYEQLNAQSNALAHHLIHIGVVPGEIVALLTERSVDTIVGLLGILKAGAAYLPITATYPNERIAQMIAGTHVQKVVLQQHLQERLPLHTALQQIDVQDIPASQEPQAPAVTWPKASIAYVIFTSGSTGQPKACLLQHDNIVNYLLAIRETILFDTGIGHFPFFTPISFDFTLTGLFGALINGKTLFVFDEQQEILDILQTCFSDATSMDAIKLTPSHILLLDQLPVVSQKIKLVLSGGEALSKHHIDILQRKAPLARIVNHYGPTETTVGCIAGEIDPSGEQMYIGRPLPNVQAYILDAQLQPVPVGIPGEIVIGGKNVSAGYYQSPALTAAKFVHNPFLADGKMYRTGDIGRWHLNGHIEYLGRVDNQVKIRGNRVEPGEIETVLRTVNGIDKAVVLTDKDHQGSHRIIAFYQSANQQDIPSATLSAQLSTSLPDYMIPSFFVRVNQFPINKNGKLDSKALLALDYQQLMGTAKTAPENPAQEMLADIWQQVLGVPEIGIDDNFFELGGHSLLAMQLVSRIREAFKMDLQIRSLFKYPTIRTLQALIGESKPLTTTGLPGFVKVDRSNRIPMSYAQKRLWFLHLLQPGSTMYNMPVTLRLTGALSVPALQQSFQYLCERHEILRTVFQSIDDAFLQIIHPKPLDGFFSVEDIAVQSIEAQQHTITKQVQAATQHVFDLEHGPLIQVKLIRQSDRLHHLFINLHHIIMDEWSVGILIRELTGCYHAFLADAAPALLPMSFQYADFTAWQSALLDKVGEEQLNFWKHQLADSHPFLDLPFAKPRLVQESYKGAVIPFTIDPTISAKLRLLSKEEQGSLFMVLYSAFAVLLHKYTGNKDLLIGTPVANRNHQALESQLGFFVNTLVFRTKFTTGLSFKELLNSTMEYTLDAFANQDYPFEKLVEELNPERKQGYSPFFQTFFLLHKGQEQSLALDKVEIEPLVTNDREPKFDIVLSIDDQETLTGYLEYNADLYEAADIQQFLLHFNRVLEQVAIDPNIQIGAISLLSPKERKQVLIDWNRTEKEIPTDTVMDMIGQFKDTIALDHNDQQMTYAALQEQSNRIAHFILSQNLAAGSNVAVCIERSSQLIVTLLGILKSGCAYLAIDPDYPEERKRYMISDSGAAMLLTDALQEPAFRDMDLLVRQVDMPELWSHYTTATPLVSIDPDAPAYVIYTSGSTGQPKGVCIPHKALQNLVHWTHTTFNITATGRYTQVAGISFDASVWEIWPVLSAGASLYIVDKKYLLDPVALQQLLIIQQISSSFWPTPLAEVMFRLPWPTACTLKRVMIGGDQLRQPPDERLPFTIVDNYGVSEAAVISTHSIVQKSKEAVVTIGKPIFNTCALVLDEYRQPVPAGVYGELYLGGVGLSLDGYINREALTAERFILNPFPELPYDRLYRTGDLAAYTPQGEIRYLGRIDKQVKIRGYRIEIGEIEHELLRCPGIAQAVVLSHHAGTAMHHLASFYTTVAAQSISEDELREFLKIRLPDYMIPASLTQVAAFPLNQNGKLDTVVLQAYLSTAILEEAMPLQTPTEHTLAALWTTLLPGETMSGNSHFFELGGHSLMVTMLRSRIQEAFGIALPLKFFFDVPRLKDMASRLDQMNASPGNTPQKTAPIQKAARQHYKI